MRGSGDADFSGKKKKNIKIGASSTIYNLVISYQI